MNVEKEVERYEFEKPNPIKGYPELYWRGKRPFTSTQYYPAQLKERYGEEDENGWINKIFWGDNLQVMSHMLKEYRGKIKLIYIDPPFDSKVDYKKNITIKGKKISNDINSFEEKQYTDIWANDEYLQFMYERLILMKELLSNEGLIYVHCDWHKSHYLRCILDDIFGRDNFVNNLVWCYKTRQFSKTYWNRKHDDILVYSKGKSWTFNYEKVLDEYSESTIKKYKNKDDKGYYRLCGRGIEGSPIKSAKDVDPIWEITHPELVVRNYLGEGYPPSDYFFIDIENQVSKDRTDYPTQKPTKLLERIILASSNPGDIVFDCFMGSGTTQAVAMKLGRKFIGSDINTGAIETTIKRLVKINDELNVKNYGFEVYSVNNYELFRNPIEAKELLMKALNIQLLNQNVVYDGELNGRMAKIMPINRITTRADLGELIASLPYREFEKRETEHPNLPVEKITLICMGHEQDLKGYLQSQVDYNIDIEIVDILRDKTELEFKRESEAKIIIDEDLLVIHKFYPRNLLQKMSLLDEDVEDWRQLVESVCIDFNYDGAVMEPLIKDIPNKNELVKGKYKIPKDAGIIKVKITDLLSETFEWEGAYEYGNEIGIEPVCSV